MKAVKRTRTANLLTNGVGRCAGAVRAAVAASPRRTVGTVASTISISGSIWATTAAIPQLSTLQQQKHQQGQGLTYPNWGHYSMVNHVSDPPVCSYTVIAFSLA